MFLAWWGGGEGDDDHGDGTGEPGEDVGVVGISATMSVSKAMSRDIDVLLQAAEEHGWTDNTPVPPDCLGAIWPNGPPAGWPADDESDAGLVLDFEVPEGVTDEEVAERVRGVLAALDQGHRSLGGSGLKIRSTDAFCSTATAAGVPT